MPELEEISRVRADATLLYSESQVYSALDAMSIQISVTLADQNPLVLCVLTGGIMTVSNLMERCDFPMTCDVIHATRYGNDTVGHELDWISLPRESMKGRTVLLVDDILDEGHTLKAISQYCKDQGAESVYSAVLVEKILSKQKPIKAEFVGLQCEDRYLFGFGMDYKGYWRNTAGIFACNGV